MEVMSLTVPAMEGSVLRRSSTFLMELRTVAWFLSSYSAPMSFRERFVKERIRYMETCLAMAVFFARLGFAAHGREQQERRKVHQQPRNTVKSGRKAG